MLCDDNKVITLIILIVRKESKGICIDSPPPYDGSFFQFQNTILY